MSQGLTAADVYLASTVLLAADLATVTTQTCHVLTYIYHSKRKWPETLYMILRRVLFPAFQIHVYSQTESHTPFRLPIDTHLLTAHDSLSLSPSIFSGFFPYCRRD